ncbi:hypothetical protein D3C80_1224290 [compost metagenome]
MLIQCLDQPLPQTGKELRVIQLAPSSLGLTVFRVGKNQVYIGREVQLAAAQFPHAEDQQRLGYALGVARGAPLTAAGLIQPVASADDQRFRQPAQLQQRLLRAAQILRLRPGDPHQRLAAEQT